MTAFTREDSSRGHLAKLGRALRFGAKIVLCALHRRHPAVIKYAAHLYWWIVAFATHYSPIQL